MFDSKIVYNLFKLYSIHNGMSYQEARQILLSRGWVPVINMSTKSDLQYPEIRFPALEKTALFEVIYKKEDQILSFYVSEGHTVANPAPIEGWFIDGLE